MEPVLSLAKNRVEKNRSHVFQAKNRVEENRLTFFTVSGRTKRTWYALGGAQPYKLKRLS
jgi:hypothetical protein